jgi:ABC-type Fe3+-hydroxamate transport system substrate-binding protein
MPPFTDALGISFSLPARPQRIVSLVPSQTELLHYLGLETEVVGITKFCVHPKAWHQSKIRVGGTKQLHLDIIRELRPDLVIANKEENIREHIEEIRRFCPVFTTDVSSLHDALQMIRTIGALVQKEPAAMILAERIADKFGHLPVQQPLLRAAYLIWKNPYMVAGGGTFIDDMMRCCGLLNIFSDQKRYPEIDPEQLREQSCEVVLLSSEPYPFREKDIAEILPFVRGGSVKRVDGEMFSWYGSRLLKATAYFRQLMIALHHRGS